VAVLVVALLLAVLAAPAQAADVGGWQRVPDAGYVFTDGDRLAAWMLDADTVRVRERGSEHDLELPGACSGGLLLAVGGARLLFECPLDASYALMDARAGTLTPPPPMPFSDGDEVTPFAVGAQWLAAHVTDDEGEADYIGYARLDGSGAVRAPGGTRVVPDLDLPELLRPLCRPLRRNPASSGYLYEPPLGLTRRGPAEEELVLDRCGSERVELAPCRGVFACANPALTPRYAAWSAGRGTFLYDDRTGARKRWRSPLGKRNVAVALTRRRLYVSYRTPLEGPSSSFRRLSPP
jgi:hypothetical protein